MQIPMGAMKLQFYGRRDRAQSTRNRFTIIWSATWRTLIYRSAAKAASQKSMDGWFGDKTNVGSVPGGSRLIIICANSGYCLPGDCAGVFYNSFAAWRR